MVVRYVPRLSSHVVGATNFSHWLRLREEKVVAKGKGEVITYWLEAKLISNGSKSSSNSGSCDITNGTSAPDTDAPEIESNCQTSRLSHSRKSNKICLDKVDRLIDWNTDNLLRLLQQIMNSRQNCTVASKSNDQDQVRNDDAAIEIFLYANPFDEVKEIIALPQVQKSKMVYAETLVPVSADVSKQLREFVATVAYMYNNNCFHSFEHVSQSDFQFLFWFNNTLFVNFFICVKSPFTRRRT